MNHPKVSVLMPSLNVVKYIEQCMESVVNQTLKEIEIICVDAGSTDGTLEVLQRYAEKDPRVKLILSDHKSYGYQMNLGLDSAHGKYVGIVETDDWAEPDMFEVLWSAAEKNEADMVRAGYFDYYTLPAVRNVEVPNLYGCPTDKVLVPRAENRPLYACSSIWSGIYSLDMLRKNEIRFLESPGASYQDTSFFYSVCCVSKRAYYLDCLLIHYRKDNESSSINDVGKVYCIRDEFHYLEQYLRSHSDDFDILWKQLLPLKLKLYLWNYYRISPKYQWSFLQVIHDEFIAHFKQNQIDQNWFIAQEWSQPYAWSDLIEITERPYHFFLRTCKENAVCPHWGTLLTNPVSKKVFRGLLFCKNNGLLSTFRKTLSKLY